jgi:hypothetical protein
MSLKTFVPSTNTSTWDTIANRLLKFSPSIPLGEFIDLEAQKTIKVFGYTSEGVTFSLSKPNRDELLRLLRQAKTESGKKAFEEGRWKGAAHAAKGAVRDLASGVTGRVSEDNWAMNISFKATKGIGFREIWYLELSERQLRMKHAWAPRLEQPPLDPQFTGLFSAPNESIDLSSLHWAITDINPDTGRAEECNIHIDQVGVTANLGSGAAITPDLAYHTLVELAFRTGLKGILPDEVLQSVNFILPSSHENYALNFGVEVTPYRRDDLSLSFRGLCSHSDKGWGCSATVNLKGTFNWWDSK